MGCGGEEDCCDLSLVGHGKQDGERLKVSRKHLCVAKHYFLGGFVFFFFLSLYFVGFFFDKTLFATRLFFGLFLCRGDWRRKLQFPS